MTTPLAGRTAIVTGAAGAIGLATVQRLARAGAAVLLVDRRMEPLQAALDDLRAAGHEVEGLAGDVTEPDLALESVEAAHRLGGSLDIVVPIAGVVGQQALSEIDRATWLRVQDINLYASVLLVQAAREALARSDQGRVVLMSSIAADGNPEQSAYAAAKAGIRALARSLAAELGPVGVTVNAVAPGFIASRLTAAIATQTGRTVDDVEAAYAANIAVGRVGQPEDVAGVVNFLCGPEAGFVSGQTITIDGGPTGWRLE